MQTINIFLCCLLATTTTATARPARPAPAHQFIFGHHDEPDYNDDHTGGYSGGGGRSSVELGRDFVLGGGQSLLTCPHSEAMLLLRTPPPM